MIWNTDPKEKYKANIEMTINSLEKSKELLDKRYKDKEVDSDYYVKKSKEINDKINSYKSMLER